MYDVMIIGAGPAGMTAAIYTARKGLSTLLIAKEAGGQMSWTTEIQNYTGFSVISGAELTDKFQHHVEELKDKIDLKLGAEVIELEKNITSFGIHDSDGNAYYGKAAILATGKVSKKLGIPGEDKFYGKGVSTCATCDAPLYKNKIVAVVGGGNSALEAILSLSKIAKTVYAININDQFTGDKILRDKALKQLNIIFMHSTQTLEIIGDNQVKSIKVQKFSEEEKTINLDGVFVEIGYTVPKPFENLVERNSSGEIKVDNNLQTTVPGIFAAGDSNDAWGDQIIIAAGEGAKAAMAVNNYLSRL